jgi:hypothetical protein
LAGLDRAKINGGDNGGIDCGHFLLLIWFVDSET